MVYGIIQEYLDKNRFFKENEIIPYIQSRFTKSLVNVNTEGIRLILKSLADKNYILKRSKLTRTDILENTNRNSIYKHIKNNPGIYFYNIVKDLEMTIPVVGWHLRMLEEFNFVIREKMNGHESYFDSSINPKERKLHFLFSKEKSRSIVEFLAIHNEGITKTELSKELKMSRNTIKKYIDRFYKIGVLNTKKISNKTLYSLKEEYSIFKSKELKIKE